MLLLSCGFDFVMFFVLCFFFSRTFLIIIKYFQLHKKLSKNMQCDTQFSRLVVLFSWVNNKNIILIRVVTTYATICRLKALEYMVPLTFDFAFVMLNIMFLFFLVALMITKCFQLNKQLPKNMSCNQIFLNY